MPFTPNQRKSASLAALSVVAAVGIAALVFKTYPHLKPSFLSEKETSSEDKPLSDSTVVVDKEVSDWSDADLKAFLAEKDVTVPETATHAELVALVEQLK